MIAGLRNTFRVSFIMSDAPMPIASASELLADVRLRPVWDGASISPADAQYPRVHVDWYEGHGFVFQCYEDEESWSDFLAASQSFSAPSIEYEMDGFLKAHGYSSISPWNVQKDTDAALAPSR